MIKVFGSVSTVSYTSSSDVTKVCAEDCLTTLSCALAYLDPEGQCQFYYLSVLMTVNKGDNENGNTVALKVNVPDDSCPGTLSESDFSFTTNSGKVVSWDQTPESWTIGGCADGWTLFQRDEVNNNAVICMKIINQTNINQTVAKMRCEAMSQTLEATVKLTGVASVEERLWIHGQILALGAIGNYTGVWIDGDHSCASETPRCANFEWSDGYTIGKDALGTPNANTRSVVRGETAENCLSIVNMTSFANSSTINDELCGTRNIIYGFVCGYRLD
ncbi:hypothetical protein CAEBREN_08475 [Caenorhabditis brenneri]|uniref:PAN-3 domain-containing protein n=1 Tax=Caenorhabditis brenneri TaxID=135651 RepID=G0NPD7_CAEBE|nr:hypothetical protein CAEBREN_08475 [Caenorhabditis brenneri]